MNFLSNKLNDFKEIYICVFDKENHNFVVFLYSTHMELRQVFT